MEGHSHERHIQLTHLPTLDEIDHGKTEAAVVKILSKAVALQLKPMKADISKFAFEHLMILIDDQINDMIGQLHRFSNVQRRESIAKGDVQLFLQGYNLTPADLDEQHQASQYYSKTYGKEFDSLHSLKETFTDAVVDEDKGSEDVINELVRPNNPLIRYIPKWMPAFPPDHTYKFTPQYNQPITDETIIRRRIVDEGKQSEVALLHLLKNMNPPTPSSDVDGASYDEVLVKEETAAIYGNEQKKRKKNASSSSDLLSKLPQTNFSIEEYARSRVEIARKKVVEYEERQMKLQRNPFIKYSKIALSNSSDKSGRRQATREIHSMLQRSLQHLIKSIPVLQTTKQDARRDAEQKRDERLQELRDKKAQKLKNFTDQQLENGDINLLDLDENNDDFFNYSGSEDEDLPQAEFENPSMMHDISVPKLPTPAPEEHSRAEAQSHSEVQPVIESNAQPEAQIQGQSESQAQAQAESMAEVERQTPAQTETQVMPEAESHQQRSSAESQHESASPPEVVAQPPEQESDEDDTNFLFDEPITTEQQDEIQL